MQYRQRWTVVGRSGANQDIVAIRLRVFDFDVEEPAVERARVPKFKLALHS